MINLARSSDDALPVRVTLQGLRELAEEEDAHLNSVELQLAVVCREHARFQHGGQRHRQASDHWHRARQARLDFLIHTHTKCIHCNLTEEGCSKLSVENSPCLSSSNVSSFTAISRVRQCLKKSWHVKSIKLRLNEKGLSPWITGHRPER